MRVALVHNCFFPVTHYGGTERVIWWLAKSLTLQGIEVLLVARFGSRCPFAECVSYDFHSAREDALPAASIYHYFSTPPYLPERPHLVTIGGNAHAGERFLRNTVFVSRNHASRHNASCFVYNGVDPDDYLYSEKKDGSLLFLAKASWRVKNVKGAIRIARRVDRVLNIVGGERPWLPRWRSVYWRGMLGGAEKARFVASASGLLFPVIWDEPFGLAVIEALVSGTPALVSRRGSLPELVENGRVGVVCDSYEDFFRQARDVNRFRPRECREWALSRFHYSQMASNYMKLYARVLNKETLNARDPFCTEAQGAVRELSLRNS